MPEVSFVHLLIVAAVGVLAPLLLLSVVIFPMLACPDCGIATQPGGSP